MASSSTAHQRRGFIVGWSCSRTTWSTFQVTVSFGDGDCDYVSFRVEGCPKEAVDALLSVVGCDSLWELKGTPCAVRYSGPIQLGSGFAEAIGSFDGSRWFFVDLASEVLNG